MNKAMEPIRLDSIEELHTLFFDVMSDGVLIVDDQGRIRDCNSVFHQRLGYTREELLGRSVAALDPPDFAMKVPERLEAIMREGRALIETAHYRRDGSVMPVELNAHLARIGDETLIFSVVRDISSRKQAEEILARREHELATIFDSSPIIIFYKDTEGRFIRVNRVFAEALQMQPESFIGRTVYDLYSADLAGVMAADDREVLDSGKAKLNIIEQYESKGGRRWVSTDKFPIFDDDGAVSGLVGFAQDINDYKQAEEQLRQAQKMEAIGTLVGGIAHDFNNILGGITGNLFLARRRVEDRPEVVEKLDKIEQLSFRASHMIRQLLMFARRERLEMKPFGLLAFLKEVAHLIEVGIREEITFRMDLYDEELVVRGDTTQLHQALLNLLNNAGDAVAGESEPCIALHVMPFEADAAFHRRHPRVQGEHFARLSVEDNGCGIPSEILEHMYEPFYTTKEVGAGTGLGLSMVYGAVEGQGGAIEVESVPGQGTVFHLYLPRLPRESLQPTEDDTVSIRRGEGESILVVDDNSDMRSSLASVLMSLGYHVREAADGLEALELVEAGTGPVDLAIMDLVMPGMGGVEAAERIRAIAPSTRIIFTTGYDREAVLQEADLPAGQTILYKPCRVEKLSRMLRQELEGR